MKRCEESSHNDGCTRTGDESVNQAQKQQREQLPREVFVAGKRYIIRDLFAVPNQVDLP
ncbi:MAG: hypothetical protein HWN68_14640 [Desulfobacterales bacterium]|nr:hypothetical protein [Desulfobacterales bacterium]